MTDVTVVIPTHNRLHLLTRAVNSVLAQDYEEFEVVVVDDGSDEDTSSVLEEYDDKVRLLEHDKNRGVAAARNTGIAASRGEYVAFLDSDDEWLPGKLDAQIDRLRNSRAGVAYCGHYLQDDTTDRIKRQTGTQYTGSVYEEMLAGWCPATTSLFVVDRDLFNPVGTFEQNIPSFEDYDLWLRLARESNFVAVSDPLVIKHEHSSQQISLDPTTRRYGLNNFIHKWHEEIASYHGESAVDSVRWDHLADVLKTEALEYAQQGNRGKTLERYVRHMILKRQLPPTDLVRLATLLVGFDAYESFQEAFVRRTWDSISSVAITQDVD